MTATNPPLSRRAFHALWTVPLILLLIGTLAFRATDWDHQLAGRYFHSETGEFSPPLWVTFVYHYAHVPGMILAIGSLLLLGASLFLKRVRRWRRLAGFFVLSMALGPGLIVNAVFKDHWGRPRPKQVEEFGGDLTFLPVGTPGSEKVARSFPSGHASVAFFLVSPFFVFLARKRRLAWICLLAGLGWGGIVGFGRMAEGGHWASDVMWAAGMVYGVAFLLAWAFGFVHPAPSAKRYSHG